MNSLEGKIAPSYTGCSKDLKRTKGIIYVLEVFLTLLQASAAVQYPSTMTGKVLDIIRRLKCGLLLDRHPDVSVCLIYCCPTQMLPR